MKTKLSNILIVIQALAAICMLGAVKIWAPVCGKMLELANGREVHMKCWYTGQVAIGLAIIILTAAVMAFIARKGHKGLMVVSAVSAVVLFLMFTSMIGVCASETMRCQVTRLWGIGAAAVTFAASLVELISGKEGQVPG